MLKKKVITLRPVGVDGSAAVTKTMTLGRSGCIRFIAVDYVSQPVTTDIVIKADSSTGATLLTLTSSNTDIAAKPVGMAGIDEAGAALAATDASAGGFPFGTGLYFSVAQGDGQTTGDELVEISVWIES